MMPKTETTEETIVTFICSQIANSLPQGTELNSETDITTDTDFDSVAVMDLVFELETEYDVSIPLNELTEIRKIGELAGLVKKLQMTTA
jgi:acyl carrier protein